MYVQSYSIDFTKKVNGILNPEFYYQISQTQQLLVSAALAAETRSTSETLSVTEKSG